MNADIPRLGHADDRMQQKHTVKPGDGAFGNFLMNAMEWVSSLEGDYIGPAILLQLRSYLSRGHSQVKEIEMLGKL
jgi:hypothetical protein